MRFSCVISVLCYGVLFLWSAESRRTADAAATDSPIPPLRLDNRTLRDDEWWSWDVKRDSNENKGLFPLVFNLATNAIVSSNATCGETEPEVYCKLVEHVFMREPQCGLCDAKSDNLEHRHPVINAIDGTNKWWQSPTLQNGKHFEWVTITVDLRQIFQVAYVIVKTAISPRPGNWILEHSRDGLSYKPWQYYALSDAECWEVYDIRPTVGKPRYRSDDEVICTSYYSKLNPLEGGEIHTSLVNGRPGIDGPSDTLRQFTTARYVRLRLQKIRTLNADLMTMHFSDPHKTDKSTTRRYFYSIKDISIGGQCVCFGHAKDCPVDLETNLLRCKCEHNTCGENCEQCCRLYQQKPWRPGTNSDGAPCEKCQCYGHADICFYDQTVADKKASLNINEEHEGGGVCIKCQHHTTGINCEQCEEGYYRPLGVKRSDPEPCRRCRCTGPGVTGFCVKDDSYIHDALYPGDCICKEGFSGSKCDRCAIGYKHYPVCKPCPCHTPGTEGGSTCEGHCVCKVNVEDSRCETCKNGYFNLDAENPDGCTSCYCSGITNICQSSNWGTKVIQTLNGWFVTDLHGLHIEKPVKEDGYLQITNDAMLGFDTYYWMLPFDYLGKKLYSYGGKLRYVLRYFIIEGEDPGEQSNSPGIILEGNNTRIGYYFGSRQIQGNITVVLPLQERAWSFLTAAGKRNRAVSHEAFVGILNNITRFLIRAKYHSDQVVGELFNVEMEIADKGSGSLNKMSSVENCDCPLGYAGLSCEVCEPGYRRVNNTFHKGICEACICNNHAYSCDPFTGWCKDCQHNTTGHHCELCLHGYHGDPLNGTPEDCKLCACPLENPENNFSPKCQNIINTDGSTDYRCTSCIEGYEGFKCERCSSGYFGNPLVVGGFCQSCNCSGNGNISDPNFCDHVSGQCLNCVGNTAGWNCHECLENHYGNAYHHDCRPCGCSPVGSESSVCNSSNGFCECKFKYDGRNCDRCVDGYGNVELGCISCQCNMTGSEERRCDPVSGQCSCKHGVFGLKCDACLEGFYSYSMNGCTWCGCDSNGAYSVQCEETSGKCQCKQNVTGRTCNKCETAHWNLLSGKGCEECKCNTTGSNSTVCDELYGKCTCHTGITGDKCDQCLPGYYGFSSTGCKECDQCKSPGHICDPVTGICVCPPNTEGEYCERCTVSSWGHDSWHGCKACNCHPRGSANKVCDLDNGNCLCLEGFEGRRCDKCRFAHYRFQDCRKCDCRHDGTDPTQCTPEGQCQCDDNGQCPCKQNVKGLKCQACKEGTFGMTLENPKGCFECFCFGRATNCSQAQMVWSQITMLAREVQFELGDTPLAVIHHFLLIPGQTGNVKLGVPYMLKKPLYWMLSRDFLGEKTRSYNGMLHFHIESRSSSNYPDPLLLRYPLILLQGNRIALVHSPILPVSGGRYSVRIHEDEWRQLENPLVPVTRHLLMIVLQNVQHILIRATEGADVKIARLRDVILEYALPISPTPASPYVAVGVEICNCAIEYKGFSCQDPGNGYYRKFKPNFIMSKNLIDLIGYSAPCPCNNRSESCDPETGHCHDCRENTTGAFCELCAKGYYGEPASGPCKPCACPLINNSFSDTCEKVKIDHVCTNCLEGYEGKNCERCSRGYYGNPMLHWGSCNACDCNAYGSLDRICDRMTGQCHCRGGITGRDCTQCRARHILTEVGCKSCEDECIGPLLDNVDSLKEMTAKSNFSNFVPAPWIPLLELDNQNRYLQKSIVKHWNVLETLMNITKNFLNHFETLADLMHLRGRDMNIKASPLAFDAHETKDDAEALFKDLDKTWKYIFDSVNKLQHQGRELNMSTKVLEKNVANSEKILEHIKKSMLIERRQEAEREMRKSLQIIQDVKNTLMDRHLYVDKNRKVAYLSKVLSEFVRLLERSVRKIAATSTVKVAEGRLRETMIHKNVEFSERNNSFTNITLLSAEDLLSHAENFLENTTVTLMMIQPLQTSLENVTQQLEYHRGVLERLNPRYIVRFVIPAKEHSDHILKQSLYLSELFSATRVASQFPLQAAKVYDEIMDTLEMSEQVAVKTLNAADRVYYEAHPHRDDSLTKQPEWVRKYSQNLHAEASECMISIQAHRNSVEKKKMVLEEIFNQVVDGISSIATIEEEIDMLPRDLGDVLLNITEEHKSTEKMMIKVHRKVDSLVHMINEELYPKLDHLRVGSSAGLFNITSTIKIAKSTTNTAITKANMVEARVERVKQVNDQMQLNVKMLRNKILLARQKASNIRVSLSSDRSGICVRSYRPEIVPSSTNNIVLNYAINTDANDSLLFFLASSIAKDFMILEMVNRKIHFLWNTGGGTQIIQHNRTIYTNDEQFLKNEYWYKIEVIRFGNIAKLSVKPTPGGHTFDQYEVTAASPTGFSIMDLDPNSLFYIGGTPKGYRVPRELKARNFAGCLHEVVLDGKKVGLWNFLTNQGCDGCKEGATEEADFGAYSFKGDGYAVLHQIKRYRKHSYDVTLRFKTFDEDALLFFTPNIQNGDFVSLELRNGHVVYQFNLGSQSRSVLKTVGKYNTGNWTRLTATKEKLQVWLAVDEEFLEGQLPAGGPTVMELQKSHLYYGGVPPNFSVSLWTGITFQKFFGCVKDLQIDSTPIGLLKNEFYGVEANCRDDPIRVVSFRGQGYFEIGSHPLLQEASFGFSFQSSQKSAVLLLSTFDPGMTFETRRQDFYSVALVNGHLEARFNGGDGVAIISSTVLVNDGNYHTVTIVKRHRKITMKIDDIDAGSTRLPKGAKEIDAPQDRGLFLGGFKEHILFDTMISTKLSLIGSIKDVIFNSMLLHFNEPVSFGSAGIGRSQKDWYGMEEPYTGITQQLERCVEMASYVLEKYAVKFGDELHSYAEIAIGRKDLVHNFNISLNLRTFYPSGLIVFAKNGRGVSHFALMMQSGKVVMSVWDRQLRRVMSVGSINDGKWHNVIVNKTGRHMMLRVDYQKKALNLKVRRRIALRSPLYVGGVPEDMPSVEEVVVEKRAVTQFKGCIKNFFLNENYVDLASGELHSVGHCFSTIEPGAYFSGDAYAIYERKFEHRNNLDIQMEFKTTRINGILLFITKTFGTLSLALELYNGSVIISVDLGDGQTFQAFKNFQSKYEMCDGRWHLVTAQYTNQTVTLKVDMYDVSYGLNENISHKLRFQPLDLTTILRIGGLPEGSPQGALHSRDNFVGCLKNVAIDNERVDWLNMTTRYNLLPNACPTF